MKSGNQLNRSPRKPARLNGGAEKPGGCWGCGGRVRPSGKSARFRRGFAQVGGSTVREVWSASWHKDARPPQNRDGRAGAAAGADRWSAQVYVGRRSERGAIGRGGSPAARR